MSWLHNYHNRIVSAEEAVESVKSEQPRLPHGKQLGSPGPHEGPRRAGHVPVERRARPGPHAREDATTPTRSSRAPPGQHALRRARTCPRGRQRGARRLHAVPPLRESRGSSRKGVLPLDVAFIHVTPPDEHGFCSFGVEVGVRRSAAQAAKLVIAELNPNMPRTLGDAFIHISRIHKIVPVDYPIFTEAKLGKANRADDADRQARRRDDRGRLDDADGDRRDPRRAS